MQNENKKRLDIDRIKSESAGKWFGIFERLGISVLNNKHQACPICGPGNNSHRFRCDNKEGKGTWICTQCGSGDGFSLIQKVLGIEFIEACEKVNELIGVVDYNQPPKENRMSPELMREIFKESTKTVQGDAVWHYLKNRGLKMIPNNIRTHMNCYEPETGKKQIAMLAIFQLQDGTAVTMHRTFIQNGYKLKVKSPKKILPPIKKMTGGCVRLFEPNNGYIAITEGIETAIAVHERLDLPVWSALSSSMLEAWEPPVGIKKVTIFGDSDRNYTGQKAAYTLANKLYLKNKIDVDVELPKTIGNDFLDEINSVHARGK